MLKVSGTPTEYGSSTLPPKKMKQSKVCSTLWPLATLVGILICVCIGYCTFMQPIRWYRVDFLCALETNFTKEVKLKHDELKHGMSQFLKLIGEMDESVLVYSEDIIQQVNYDIQKGIANLKDLQKSTKPKVRRRPPVERWNSTT